jgi:hypothetical protein
MSTEGNIIEKLVAILKDLLLGKPKQVQKQPKEEKASAPVCPALKGLPAKAASSPPKAQPLKGGNVKQGKSGMLHAKNNSPRLKKELKQLEVNNPELHALIIDLYKWISDKFGKDTIITMIYRTQAEQDRLYRYSQKYQEKKFKSPHQFWHAIDLRTWIYTEEEIDQIVQYLNDKYNSRNYYSWTAKAHAIKGNARHFHIQFIKSS